MWVIYTDGRSLGCGSSNTDRLGPGDVGPVLYTESLFPTCVDPIIQTGCVLGMCSSSTDRLCPEDVDLVTEMVVSRC
jgi:hypothetical protein